MASVTPTLSVMVQTHFGTEAAVILELIAENLPDDVNFMIVTICEPSGSTSALSTMPRAVQVRVLERILDQGGLDPIDRLPHLEDQRSSPEPVSPSTRKLVTLCAIGPDQNKRKI